MRAWMMMIWRRGGSRGVGEQSIFCFFVVCWLSVVCYGRLHSAEDGSLLPSYTASSRQQNNDTPSPFPAPSLTPPIRPHTSTTTTTMATSMMTTATRPGNPDPNKTIVTSPVGDPKTFDPILPSSSSFSSFSSSSLFSPSASSNSSHPFSAGMERDILRKLLDERQIQSLVSRLITSSIQVGATASNTNATAEAALSSVHIVGLSPAFANALGQLQKVTQGQPGGSASAVTDGPRVRRQAGQGVEAEISNVSKQGNSSEVTVDFFLKTPDGKVESTATALKTLNSLSRKEMSALLGVAVISNIQAVTISVSITSPLLTSATQVASSSASSSTPIQSMLVRSKRAMESVISVETVASSSSSSSYTASVLGIAPTSVLMTPSMPHTTVQSGASSVKLSHLEQSSPRQTSNVVTQLSLTTSATISTVTQSFTSPASERTSSSFAGLSLPESSPSSRSQPSPSFVEITHTLSPSETILARTPSMLFSSHSVLERTPSLSSLLFSERTTSSSFVPISSSSISSLFQSPSLSHITPPGFSSHLSSISVDSERSELVFQSPSYFLESSAASFQHGTTILSSSSSSAASSSSPAASFVVSDSSSVSLETPVVSSSLKFQTFNIMERTSPVILTSPFPTHVLSSPSSSLVPSLLQTVSFSPSSVMTERSSNVSVVPHTTDSLFQTADSLWTSPVFSSDASRSVPTFQDLQSTFGSSVINTNMFSSTISHESTPQLSSRVSSFQVPSRSLNLRSSNVNVLSLSQFPSFSSSLSPSSTPTIPDVSSIVTPSVSREPIKSSLVSLMDRSAIRSLPETLSASLSVFSQSSALGNFVSSSLYGTPNITAMSVSDTQRIESATPTQGLSVSDVYVSSPLMATSPVASGLQLSSTFSSSIISDLSPMMTSQEVEHSGTSNIITSPVFSNVMTSPVFSNIMTSPVFSNIMTSPVFSNIMTSPVFSNIMTSPVFSNIMTSPVFSNVMTSPVFSNVMTSSVFSNIMTTPVFSNIMTSPVFSNIVTSPELISPFTPTPIVSSNGSEASVIPGLSGDFSVTSTPVFSDLFSNLPPPEPSGLSSDLSTAGLASSEMPSRSMSPVNLGSSSAASEIAQSAVSSSFPLPSHLMSSNSPVLTSLVSPAFVSTPGVDLSPSPLYPSLFGTVGTSMFPSGGQIKTSPLLTVSEVRTSLKSSQDIPTLSPGLTSSPTQSSYSSSLFFSSSLLPSSALSVYMTRASSVQFVSPQLSVSAGTESASEATFVWSSFTAAVPSVVPQSPDLSSMVGSAGFESMTSVPGPASHSVSELLVSPPVSGSYQSMTLSTLKSLSDVAQTAQLSRISPSLGLASSPISESSMPEFPQSSSPSVSETTTPYSADVTPPLTSSSSLPYMTSLTPSLPTVPPSLTSSSVIDASPPSLVSSSRPPGPSVSLSQGGVTPTYSLVMSATASFSSDVIRPPGSEPRTFLSMTIRVPSGVNITSAAFLNQMREAIPQMYLAALKKSQTAQRRRKRQAENAQAEVLGIKESGKGEVRVDFNVQHNGQQVPTDAALRTLRQLTAQEMSNLVSFPVLTLTQQVTVNGTVTVTTFLGSGLVATTTRLLVIATPSPSAMTPSFTPLTPSRDLTASAMTSAVTSTVSSSPSYAATVSSGMTLSASGLDSKSTSPFPPSSSHSVVLPTTPEFTTLHPSPATVSGMVSSNSGIVSSLGVSSVSRTVSSQSGFTLTSLGVTPTETVSKSSMMTSVSAVLSSGLVDSSRVSDSESSSVLPPFSPSFSLSSASVGVSSISLSFSLPSVSASVSAGVSSVLPSFSVSSLSASVSTSMSQVLPSFSLSSVSASMSTSMSSISPPFSLSSVSAVVSSMSPPFSLSSVSASVSSVSPSFNLPSLSASVSVSVSSMSPPFSLSSVSSVSPSFNLPSVSASMSTSMSSVLPPFSLSSVSASMSTSMFSVLPPFSLSSVSASVSSVSPSFNLPSVSASVSVSMSSMSPPFSLSSVSSVSPSFNLPSVSASMSTSMSSVLPPLSLSSVSASVSLVSPSFNLPSVSASVSVSMSSMSPPFSLSSVSSVSPSFNLPSVSASMSTSMSSVLPPFSLSSVSASMSASISSIFPSFSLSSMSASVSASMSSVLPPFSLSSVSASVSDSLSSITPPFSLPSVSASVSSVSPPSISLFSSSSMTSPPIMSSSLQSDIMTSLPSVAVTSRASSDVMTPSFDASSLMTTLVPSLPVPTLITSLTLTAVPSYPSLVMSSSLSIASSPVLSTSSDISSGVLSSLVMSSLASPFPTLTGNSGILPTLSSFQISSELSSQTASASITPPSTSVIYTSSMSSSLFPTLKPSSAVQSSADTSIKFSSSSPVASELMSSLSSSSLSSSRVVASSDIHTPGSSSISTSSFSSLTSSLSPTPALPSTAISSSSPSVITTAPVISSTVITTSPVFSSSSVITTTAVFSSSSVITTSVFSSPSVITTSPVVSSGAVASSAPSVTSLPSSSSVETSAAPSQSPTPPVLTTSAAEESSSTSVVVVSSGVATSSSVIVSTPIESPTSIPMESSTSSPVTSSVSSYTPSTPTVFSPSPSSTPSQGPTWTLSPSPTSSAITPSSSVGPDSETLREALLRVDLDLRPDQDHLGTAFRESFQQGMVTAYRRGLQSRRKRRALPDDVNHYADAIVSDLRHRTRYARQAGPQIEAKVTDVIRNSTDAGITNVTFYMAEDGKLIPASNTSAALNKLTPNALSAILGFAVVAPVRAVSRPPTGEGPFDEGVGLLFLVAIVLPCVLLLLLILLLGGFLLRSCRHSSAAADLDGSDVMGTKYQRGERLHDYNLHVDMERGEIVDRTPGHTPQPPSHHPHSLNKTPLPSDKEDTLDSKRRMIDQWLKGDHKHVQESDTDSVTKSDTYLYARPKEKKPRRPPDVSAAESYKNEYLQALKMSQTDLTEEEMTGQVSGKRSESYLLQERSFEDDRSQRLEQSPQQGRPPQAKPRSFVGKVRESIRKRQRSATPDYNTQSTVMSVLGNSTHDVTERSTSRETSAEREEDPGAHHTDASDEFTISMMPVVGRSAHSSRERLDDPRRKREDPGSRDVSRRGRSRDRSEPKLKKSTEISKGSSLEEDPDLRIRQGRPPAPKDGDDSTLCADSLPRNVVTAPHSKEDLVPILRAIQTQTSLTSWSDVSTEEEVVVRSVGVGPSGVNRRTQTTVPRDKSKDKQKRKAARPERGAGQSRRQPLLSSTSSSESPESVVTMEEEVMEEEFLPERIEPFAKMSQVGYGALDKETTIPVKFRRNLFEEGPLLADPAEESALNVQKQQMFYKPAHHMRGQPRAAYSAMNPEQRRQTELLDTMRARQQMLLHQQQEVSAFAQRQHLEQQAQQLVNSACLLAPQKASQPTPGVAWTPTPPPALNPVLSSSLAVPAGVGGLFGAAAPGAPGGFPDMNQEELMQAVRKELKRMQQE